MRLRRNHAALSFPFWSQLEISILTIHRRSTLQVTVHRRSPRRCPRLVEAGFHRDTAFTPYSFNSVSIFDSCRHTHMYAVISPALQHLGSNHHKRYTCDAIMTETGSVIVPVSAPIWDQHTYRSSQKHPVGDCPPQEPSQVSSLGGGRVPSRHCIHTTPIPFSFHYTHMYLKSSLYFSPDSPARRRLGSSHHKRYTCSAITTESDCVIVHVPAQC